MDGYRKAKEVELKKFEKVGDSIIGEFIRLEKSAKYEDGYAVKMRDEKSVFVVFVNNQCSQLIETEGIAEGDEIAIVWEEEKKNEKGDRKYRVYGVYVKE